MLSIGRAALLIALAVCGCASPHRADPSPAARGPAASASPEPWPDSTWPSAPPEAEGFDADQLGRLLRRARETGTPIHSLQVVRHGRLVLDAYFWPYSASWPHDVASVTKSVVSVLYGMAIADGRMREDDPALGLPGGPVEGNAGQGIVRVVNLLDMRSGLDCGRRSGEPELRALQASGDWLASALALRAVEPPGRSFAYCSPGYHILSGLLTRATGQAAAAYARERLFRPLGIADVDWPADPQGISRGWGDLRLMPLDMARIGYLYLRGGRWRDAQLVPAAWVARSITGGVAAAPGRQYALGWWNYDGPFDHVFEAVGRGGQRISVLPALDLVVVWTGGGFDPKELGELLGNALLRKNGALSPNPAADARLADELRRIAEPPPAGPPGTPPPNAPALGGRRVELGPNGAGLRALTFTPGAGAEATLQLELADRTVTLAVGLDGVGRFSRGLGPSPTLARARWAEDGSLSVVVDLVAGINRYLIVLRPTPEGLRAEIREGTGLVNDTVPARVVP